MPLLVRKFPENRPRKIEWINYGLEGGCFRNVAFLGFLQYAKEIKGERREKGEKR